MIREIILPSWIPKIPCTSLLIVVYLSLTVTPAPVNAARIIGLGICGAEIQGNYVLVGNPAATLAIEANKIYAKGPSVNISAEYSIGSSRGSQVTISITDAGSAMGTALITIDNEILHIRNNYYFKGDWKRR